MVFPARDRRRRKSREVSFASAFVRLEDRLLLSAISVSSDAPESTDDALENADLESLTNESAADSDVVLDWNNVLTDVLVADEANQNPGYASRSMAMMNLAIYDAVAIAMGNPGQTFYDYDDAAFMAGSRLSADVAASQVAYVVLKALYPDQSVMLDAALEQSLAGHSPAADTSASVALGNQVGQHILDVRANDGSNAVVEYNYTDAIGSFQPDPLNPDVPAWGPGWGEVDTFAISSPESLAPDSTPAITSQEYAASYNEVQSLGSVDSTERTADQTETGIFWAYDRVGLGTPLTLYNEVLQTIALQQGNTLEENAVLFAQASVAMADAAIVAWHTKFDEDFWRPVTAIQDGAIDGNPLTDGDSDWIPLGAPDGGQDIIGFTPPFPTYISGHATFGGALFGSLQEFYGTDDIAFDLTSRELEILRDNPELEDAYGLDLDDATRTFSSLSEAMAENGRSRVYLGIHFDFDDLVGQEVGQAVAATVASEFAVSSTAEEVVARASSGTIIRSELVDGQLQSSVIGGVPTNVDWDEFHFGDFNGDGLTDAAGRSPNDGWWRVMLNDGEKLSSPQAWTRWSTAVDWNDILVGDFNGDGLDDVAGRASTGTLNASLSSGNGFTPHNFGGWSPHVTWNDVQTADLNGDGLTDILGRSHTGVWVGGLSDGTRFQSSIFGAWSTAVDWRDVTTGDFDGDGDDDVAARASTGTWVVGLSTGARFQSQVFGGWNNSAGYSDARFGDFNGDGRLDVMGQTASGLMVVGVSTGSRFDMQSWGQLSPDVNWDHILVGDFDGDGRDDLASQASTGTWVGSLSRGDSFASSTWGGWSRAVEWDNVSVGNFS